MTPTPAQITAELRARIAVYKNDDNKTFRYFCGVCWNLIRAKESGV